MQIRNSKDDETPIAAATQIFASCLSHSHVPLWKRLWVKPHVYAFEIYLINQTVYFYVTTDKDQETFVASVIAAAFPTSSIQKTADPMEEVFKSPRIAAGQLLLDNDFYYPTKTYADFEDIDTLAALVGYLGKQQPDINMVVQILVTTASFDWQARAVKKAGRMIVAAETKGAPNPQTGTAAASERYARDPQQLLIMQKASFQGGKALIRLLAGTQGQDPKPYLKNLAGTFGIFSHGDGNEFEYKRSIIQPQRLIKRIKNRTTYFFEKRHQILNAQELATIWHPPGFLMAGVKNIAWGKTLSGEPPENLPTALTATDEQKKDINFFATTNFKNQETIFGIKSADRRKHVYIIGKTGAGKSTLIANMAIDDIRKDRGIGIIDPHGDLSETILDYIPKRRLNDVVYLEPFDQERVFSLNVLEVKNKQHKDLVASGIVSIFYKIYGDSWGPRLEYILRNVIFTLLDTPDATLVDVLRVLADAGYRKRVVEGLTDPVIKDFWEKEFARMPDSLKAEAISPIQNKVGQFVSSKMVRNIIGSPKSTINLEQIMNEGKILILNLSQGKLGEDNAALLGAMIITQIQLAAMNRSFMKEEDRRDFFMYVDEFQNFATSSFIKILSEARKYRLSLTLANQYMGQLEEEVQHAIFGNVGTLISFVVGGTDAYPLSKEFAELYTESDLVSLGKFEIVMKLSIDNMTSAPFPAMTLPLPSLKNENRETIIRLAKERYGRAV
ncbi:MAG: type IV secretion system DNA-binding domain-containing protein [Candidatus Levybacteria bacterium]|nr:type IV secretion system DNA-binding domain-containing protein [Candidatus Levybacteria bacterium]